MNRISAIVALVLLVFSSPSLSADVYVWTDENGVKHYSNIAPSESTDTFNKEQELNPDAAPGSGAPPSRRRSRPEAAKTAPPSRPPASKAVSNSEGSGPASTPDPETEAVGSLRLNLKKFPISQDELVNREKTIIRGLKKELEKSGADPEAVLKKEEKRLVKAILDLSQAPMEKFGSQKNKNRQVGYYKYRLEALLNSPETYFDYGKSDSD